MIRISRMTSSHNFRRFMAVDIYKTCQLDPTAVHKLKAWDLSLQELQKIEILLRKIKTKRESITLVRVC